MTHDDPKLESKILDYWVAAQRLEETAQESVDLFQRISMPEEARNRVWERAIYLWHLGVEAETTRETISDYIGPDRTVEFVEFHENVEKEEDNND